MKTHKNIKLLSIFNFLSNFRFYAPVAILYFTKVSGSFALGMSVFSVSMISSALFEIPTGVYSDIIGRKKTLVWGAVLSIISLIFYAIGGSFTILIIRAVIEGIARSFYSGNNEAFLIDTLVETKQTEEYSHFLGRTNSMSQWAGAFSSIIGTIVASISFSLVMWLSVIPVIMGFFVSLKMTEPSVHKKGETTNIYSHLTEALILFKNNYKLRNLSISKIIAYSQGESSFQFRSAFVATLWPIWAIGFGKTLSGIGAAISLHYSGKIIKKFSAFKVLATGKLYSIIFGLFALAVPTVFSPLILASGSIFYGTSTVATSELLQKEYSSAQRSTMGSLNALFGSIGFAILAFVLGFFADQIGPAKAMLYLKLLSLVSFAFFWKALRKK